MFAHFVNIISLLKFFWALCIIAYRWYQIAFFPFNNCLMSTILIFNWIVYFFSILVQPNFIVESRLHEQIIKKSCVYSLTMAILLQRHFHIYISIPHISCKSRQRVPSDYIREMLISERNSRLSSDGATFHSATCGSIQKNWLRSQLSGHSIQVPIYNNNFKKKLD